MCIRDRIDFAVDMTCSGVTIGAGEMVFIQGSATGWSSPMAWLSDSDGDGIWTGSAADLALGSYTYKVSVGTDPDDRWRTQEELAGLSCAVVSTDGYSNRGLDVTGDAAVSIAYGLCESTCPGS